MEMIIPVSQLALVYFLPPSPFLVTNLLGGGQEQQEKLEQPPSQVEETYKNGFLISRLRENKNPLPKIFPALFSSQDS